MMRSSCCVVLISSLLLLAAAAPPRYSEDFENTEMGKVPADMTVLNGNFAIHELEGNHFLELAGEPLETFGALFGPKDSAACDVRARIWADASGRRCPEFGIGADDAQGFKLLLLPGQGRLQLRQGDETRASVRCDWKPGTWTWLRLRVDQSAENKWSVRGRAWAEGSPEPTEWMIEFELPSAPSAGRASLWGLPFSGRPIRFDDLRVE